MTLKGKKLVRLCLTQPEVWVLLGTPLPPFNVLWAFGFWFGALVRYGKAPEHFSRCLNIQLTYTLLLAIPFVVSDLMTRIPSWRVTFVPGSQASLVAGLTLGLVSAGAIILMVFFNTRAVAEYVLEHPSTRPPRLKLVKEG